MGDRTGAAPTSPSDAVTARCSFRGFADPESGVAAYLWNMTLGNRSFAGVTSNRSVERGFDRAGPDPTLYCAVVAVNAAGLAAPELTAAWYLWDKAGAVRWGSPRADPAWDGPLDFDVQQLPDEDVVVSRSHSLPPQGRGGGPQFPQFFRNFSVLPIGLMTCGGEECTVAQRPAYGIAIFWQFSAICFPYLFAVGFDPPRPQSPPPPRPQSPPLPLLPPAPVWSRYGCCRWRSGKPRGVELNSQRASPKQTEHEQAQATVRGRLVLYFHSRKEEPPPPPRPN